MNPAIVASLQCWHEMIASGDLGRLRSLLAPVTLSLMCERRTRAPYGLCGGQPGAPGRNSVTRAGGETVALPGRATLQLAAGDRLCIETPGGGGYGPAE